MGDEAKPGRREPRKKKRGLQSLMLAIVYCALTFQIARPAMETQTPDSIAALAAWLGLGLVALGTMALGLASTERWLGWAAVCIGLIVTCVAALGWMGLLVASGLMFALVVANRRGRKAEAESLLWTMAIAARHGMPMADVISAYSRQGRRWESQRARVLADRLEAGAPLPQAMRSAGGLIPEEGILAAAIGLETNTLGESLSEAAANLASNRELVGPVVRRVLYVGMLLTVTQSILVFLVYFIVPKLQAIMRDFGLPLSPQATMILRGMYQVTGGGSTVIVPLIFEMATFVLLVVCVMRLLGWRAGESWVFDRINPGRHSVVVMRTLALGIEGGQPMQETVLALRKWYPPTSVRRRLVGVDQGLSRGGNWIDLLKATRFLRPAECAVLESATRAGNVPWALRTLAGQRERSFGYRLEFWSQILFPVAMILIGVGILLVGVLCYEPMSRLMEVLGNP